MEPSETQYFECSCFSPEHTLRFSYDPEDNELHTHIFLNQYRNVFKRVWVAIRYVFGYKCRYGEWDCWILKPEDVHRLKALLNRVEIR